MDKAAVLRAIIDELLAELTLQNDAAHSAHEEATNDQSRAEDRYDMRGQLAAYLAAGQAKQADETAAALKAFRSLPDRQFGAAEPAAVGALVTLKAKGRAAVYFLGPARGGLEVKVNGAAVMVITTASPVGKALFGRRVGEAVTLPERPRPVEYRIEAVE